MPTDHEHLKILTDRLDADHERLKIHDDYYEGRHPLAFATPKFKTAFGSLFRAFADNWCQIVVDTCEERLNVQGFRFGEDTDADRDAWAVWQSNDLDAGAQLVHREALVAGRAYAIVWADAAGRPRITPESPRQVAVTYAPGDRRTITAALKRWTDGGQAHASLFLPNRVVRLTARAVDGVYVPASGWTTVETHANPLGVVPVVEFTNRPSLLGRGESEIAGVVPVQDAVNKLVADLLIASEYAAFRQRWVAGMGEPTVDPDTGVAVEPFEGSVGRLWYAEDGDTKFGEFEASDLTNYVGAIEMFVQHIASQSRTPPHYFFLRGEFPSGESIQSAEAGLVAKCRRKTTHFGDAWERVMRLAFAVTGDPRADETSAETLWADVRTHTESEWADALAKRAALGVPRDQLLADLGYSPQAIERFRTMRATDTSPILTVEQGD